MASRRPSLPIVVALSAVPLAAVLVVALSAVDAPRPSDEKPTQSAAAATAPVPSQTPSASAAQAGETTLIEVATGRVYQWPEGSGVQNARFSPDSRWLTFNAGWLPGDNRGPIDAFVYRIDLQATQLAPEKLASGFNPVMSSRGDIAYVAEMDRQVASVYVRTAAGDVHKLALPGATFKPLWTPDGSHLIYAGGSNTPGKGTTGGIPVMVADARTWTSRIVDRVRVDSHGPDIELSPDGRYLYSGDHLVSVTDGVVQRVVVRGWLDADQYVVEERRGESSTVDLYSVEVRTGTRQHLGYAIGRSWNVTLGLSIENVNEETGPGTPTPAFDEYTRMSRFDGTVVIDRLQGFFGGWSPDNRYFTTGGADSKCQTTVYEVSGREVACFDGWITSWTTGKVAVLRRAGPSIADRPAPTGDVYVIDLAAGVERLVLKRVPGEPGEPCMRWSPDSRWLLADDFCDTF